MYLICRVTFYNPNESSSLVRLCRPGFMIFYSKNRLFLRRKFFVIDLGWFSIFSNRISDNQLYRLSLRGSGSKIFLRGGGALSKSLVSRVMTDKVWEKQLSKLIFLISFQTLLTYN